MIRIDFHLRLPVGQTENRDDSGRESGRFRAFRLLATRSTGGRNPAWRGDFRQEKGPGDYPSPWIWWSRRESPAARCASLRATSRPAGRSDSRGEEQSAGTVPRPRSSRVRERTRVRFPRFPAVETQRATPAGQPFAFRLVEPAGIEPASESLLRSVLRV